MVYIIILLLTWWQRENVLFIGTNEIPSLFILCSKLLWEWDNTTSTYYIQEVFVSLRKVHHSAIELLHWCTSLRGCGRQTFPFQRSGVQRVNAIMVAVLMSAPSTEIQQIFSNSNTWIPEHAQRGFITRCTLAPAASLHVEHVHSWQKCSLGSAAVLLRQSVLRTRPHVQLSSNCCCTVPMTTTRFPPCCVLDYINVYHTQPITHQSGWINDSPRMAAISTVSPNIRRRFFSMCLSNEIY